jgi:hypothetical protein
MAQLAVASYADPHKNVGDNPRGPSSDLHEHKDCPKLLVWTKTADSILAKTKRLPAPSQ